MILGLLRRREGGPAVQQGTKAVGHYGHGSPGFPHREYGQTSL